MKVGLSLLPTFLPGERVLSFKPRLWFASGKSPPTYRLWFSLPPLWEAGFYVTERRILIVFHLFRLVRLEYSLWLGKNAQQEGYDSVKEVSVGQSRLFGNYLQLVSENRTEHWYRSRDARLRLFLRRPDPVARLITGLMRQNTKKQGLRRIGGVGGKAAR